MSKTAMSFRLPDDLRERIETAAGKGNVSQWLIEAAEAKLAGTSAVIGVAAVLQESAVARKEVSQAADLPMPDDDEPDTPPSQAAFYAPETVAKPEPSRLCPICRQPLRIDDEERMWYCDGLAGCKAKGPVHDSETA